MVSGTRRFIFILGQNPWILAKRSYFEWQWKQQKGVFWLISWDKKLIVTCNQGQPSEFLQCCTREKKLNCRLSPARRLQWHWVLWLRWWSSLPWWQCRCLLPWMSGSGKLLLSGPRRWRNLPRAHLHTLGHTKDWRNHSCHAWLRWLRRKQRGRDFWSCGDQLDRSRRLHDPQVGQSGNNRLRSRKHSHLFWGRAWTKLRRLQTVRSLWGDRRDNHLEWCWVLDAWDGERQPRSSNLLPQCWRRFCIVKSTTEIGV